MEGLFGKPMQGCHSLRLHTICVFASLGSLFCERGLMQGTSTASCHEGFKTEARQELTAHAVRSVRGFGACATTPPQHATVGASKIANTVVPYF